MSSGHVLCVMTGLRPAGPRENSEPDKAAGTNQPSLGPHRDGPGRSPAPGGPDHRPALPLRPWHIGGSRYLRAGPAWGAARRGATVTASPPCLHGRCQSAAAAVATVRACWVVAVPTPPPPPPPPRYVTRERCRALSVDVQVRSLMDPIGRPGPRQPFRSVPRKPGAATRMRRRCRATLYRVGHEPALPPC